MNHKYALILLLALFCGYAQADEQTKDSLKIVDIEEVVVIATPKENRKLRELPQSATLLSQQDMQANHVNSIKSLTGLVPNIFIPDYGSKMTSAVYIRGIGSRINTPSVGLYVNNIPFIDKSAFDFNYSDIERIDVLRGPQGTLYGRNTMGGLIRIYTKSPFSYQGTDLQLSTASHHHYNASLTHYHRISEAFAFSVGGFYSHEGGFFRNSYSGKKIDGSNEAGGRIRATYFPTQNLKIDLNINYEYLDQGGYPYFYTGAIQPEKEERAEKIGKISINDDACYRRNLLNSGVNIEYQAKNFILNAVTGHQFLRDNMQMDQDFTERDIFILQQKQLIHTLSEELVLKSKPGRRWEWTAGAFGFYQWLKTNSPVTFKREGIESLIEHNANSHLPNSPYAPAMKFRINNESLYIHDDFRTPTLNAAVYYQSTLHNLFIKGLSLTAGIRFDYEKVKIDYNCGSLLDFDFNVQMITPPITLSDNMLAPTELIGRTSHEYTQFLPKFSLQYEWKRGNNVYATVSRGYRSGGYNVQMFSDLVQQEMQNSMKTALKESPKFASMADMIESMMPGANVDPKMQAVYEPEYSWNYEIGSHLTLYDNRLWIDLAGFYMDTKDQQVSRFVESGAGRITTNAGKSRSYGAEASLKASLTRSLDITSSYGYTRSTFRDFKTLNANYEETNYKGRTVPFIPKHTFNVGGQYTLYTPSCKLSDNVQLSLNYNGAGRIFWTEQNNVSQSFYATLNGRIALHKGNGQVALWAQNLLNKQYTTFYFESMGNGFRQKGRPVQVGIDVKCCF